MSSLWKRWGKPLTLQLLKSKCKVDRKTGCWNFIGDKAQKYPRINHDGVITRANVAALTLKLGRPVKSGMYAMHRCDNTRCANPAHVKEGTSHQNRLDAINKGRFGGWKLSEETKRKMSISMRRYRREEREAA